jgi:hypothetical protein
MPLKETYNKIDAKNYEAVTETKRVINLDELSARAKMLQSILDLDDKVINEIKATTFNMEPTKQTIQARLDLINKDITNCK